MLAGKKKIPLKNRILLFFFLFCNNPNKGQLNKCSVNLKLTQIFCWLGFAAFYLPNIKDQQQTNSALITCKIWL